MNKRDELVRRIELKLQLIGETVSECYGLIDQMRKHDEEITVKRVSLDQG